MGKRKKASQPFSLKVKQIPPANVLDSSSIILEDGAIIDEFGAAVLRIKPVLILTMKPNEDDPYRSVEFKTPLKDDLLRLPIWARVVFAARCAQRVLSEVLVPDNQTTAASHYSAVEQAVAFAFDCAEQGRVGELPQFRDIQLGGHYDPAVAAASCATLAPFGKGESSATLAGMAAFHANWCAHYYSGAQDLTQSFEFASQVNRSIWLDFGRLVAAAEAQHWTNSTRVSQEFFKEATHKLPVIFISYAHQDVDKAKEIFRRLRAAGFDPWLDKFKLELGDEWEYEIKRAVRAADAFVVCLRPGFDEVGVRQREVRWAREALELRPPGRGFIIPFIIEPCPLPDWCQPYHAGTDMTKPTEFNELLRAVKKHTHGG